MENNNNRPEMNDEIFDARPKPPVARPAERPPAARPAGNNGPGLTAPPPVPKFEPSHIPVRKPRKLWGIGGALLLIGLALLAAGWFNGAADGRLYLDSSGFHFNVRDNGNNALITSELQLEPFSKVEVTTSFPDINFIEDDHYGLKMELPSDMVLDWQVEHGKLTVETPEEAGFQINLLDFGYMDTAITVYYPEYELFETINVSTASGDIYAELPYTESVTFETASGDIEAEIDYYVNNIKASTASGDIDLYNSDRIMPFEAKVETVSGSIGIYDGDWFNLEAETTSGDIDIDGALHGQTEAVSVSGNVTIYSSNEGHGYEISTVSGTIYVNGREHDGIGVELNHAGENNISVETTSGDIELEFED